LKIEGSGKDVELKMGPSKEGPFVDATVHTEDVGPGTKVVWRRAANSGIISIKVVSPVPENPRIFPGDATTIILGKRRRIKVDDTGPILLENEKEYSEKYEIEVKMIGGDTPPAFDPYLRIR
jgi:hypothetical protein